MKRPPYIAHLTVEERAAAMKFGAALAMQDQIMTKGATVPGGAVDGVAKAIIGVSLVAGVPLGIAAHMVGRGISANRRKEREQLARIKYYRDATRQLESGLTSVPEPNVVQ